jgi:CheY-like chemotaxis protein
MSTVLVVDDDLDLLTAMTEALTEEGWGMVAVRSVPEAMRAVREREIDIVLCDVFLSDGGDGRALKEALARDARACHLPFVFMTASVPQVRNADGEGILCKPFRIPDLVEFLRRALDAGAQASGHEGRPG